jgi:hypothetical protein
MDQAESLLGLGQEEDIKRAGMRGASSSKLATSSGPGFASQEAAKLLPAACTDAVSALSVAGAGAEGMVTSGVVGSEPAASLVFRRVKYFSQCSRGNTTCSSASRISAADWFCPLAGRNADENGLDTHILGSDDSLP